MRRCTLTLVVGFAACEPGKDLEVYCEYSTPTGFSDDRYAFHDTNFACEGLPADESFVANGSSFSEFFDSSSALTSLSDEDVENAIEGALSTWNRVPASLDLSAEVKSSGLVTKDEDNVMVMATLSIYEQTPARAFRFIYRNSNVSCDLEVYASYRQTSSAGATVINWSISDPAPSNGLRLEDAITHELGHCLGFDHPRSNHADSIMYGAWFGHSALSLSTTDIAALQFLYPS